MEEFEIKGTLEGMNQCHLVSVMYLKWLDFQ